MPAAVSACLLAAAAVTHLTCCPPWCQLPRSPCPSPRTEGQTGKTDVSSLPVNVFITIFCPSSGVFIFEIIYFCSIKRQMSKTFHTSLTRLSHSFMIFVLRSAMVFCSVVMQPLSCRCWKLLASKLLWTFSSCSRSFSCFKFCYYILLYTICILFI